jgi:hypothetical protein
VDINRGLARCRSAAGPALRSRVHAGFVLSRTAARKRERRALARTGRTLRPEAARASKEPARTHLAAALATLRDLAKDPRARFGDVARARVLPPRERGLRGGEGVHVDDGAVPPTDPFAAGVFDLPEVVAAAKGVVDAIAVDAEDGRDLAHRLPADAETERPSHELRFLRLDDEHVLLDPLVPLGHGAAVPVRGQPIGVVALVAMDPARPHHAHRLHVGHEGADLGAALVLLVDGALALDVETGVGVPLGLRVCPNRGLLVPQRRALALEVGRDAGVA